MADRDPAAPTRPESDEGRDARIHDLARDMERNGWSGSPLVVHGDQVLSGQERYEAARFLGIEEEVPRVTLEDVYAEAGVDMPQVASPQGGADADQQFFEDYLRDLPRHVRDKYEL